MQSDSAYVRIGFCRRGLPSTKQQAHKCSSWGRLLILDLLLLACKPMRTRMSHVGLKPPVMSPNPPAHSRRLGRQRPLEQVETKDPSGTWAEKAACGQGGSRCRLSCTRQPMLCRVALLQPAALALGACELVMRPRSNNSLSIQQTSQIGSKAKKRRAGEIRNQKDE